MISQNISKIDAARITKLDTNMFCNESWKTIYFGVKRSRPWVMKTLLAWVIAFVCAGWLLVVFTAWCYASAVYAVTLLYCTKTAKHRIT